ncbi:type II toxin-antitoxin system VapC family toxin [Candidatus Woesebacteria bacterium]|nr:type II toxin-antitoxin system VapC family toxin [Candidatus Woesebacteria bacterium]
MRVVLDASVILKTVLPDENPQEVELALQLFKQYSQGEIDVIIPDFWVYEVGNTLCRKLNSKKAKLGFAFLLSLKFKNVTFSKKQLLAISAFSAKHNVSFYDSSYHLLAYFTDSIFVTADKKYFDKFKRDKHVVLLGHLKI